MTIDDTNDDGSGEFAIGFGDSTEGLSPAAAKQMARDVVLELQAQLKSVKQLIRDEVRADIAAMRQPVRDVHDIIRGQVLNDVEHGRAVVAQVHDQLRGKLREAIAYTGERLVDLYRLLPSEIVDGDEPPPPYEPPPPPPVNMDQTIQTARVAGEAYRQLLDTPGALTALERGDTSLVDELTGFVGVNPVGGETITVGTPPPPPHGGKPPVGAPANCKPGEPYCPPPWVPVYDPVSGKIVSCKLGTLGNITIPPKICPPPPPPGGGGTGGECDIPAGEGSSIPGCTWVEISGGHALCQIVYYYDACGCVINKACIPVSHCWCKLDPAGGAPGCIVCVHCSPDHPCDPAICPEGWTVNAETGMCEPAPETPPEPPAPPTPGEGCQPPDNAPDDVELVYGFDGLLYWTDPTGTQYGDSCPGADYPSWCPPVPGSAMDSEFRTLKGGCGAWFDVNGIRISDRCPPPCGLASQCEMPADAPDDAVPIVWDDGKVWWFDFESQDYFGEACELNCPWPADAPDDACLVEMGDPPCLQWIGQDGMRYGLPCEITTGDVCGSDVPIEEPEAIDFSEPYADGEFPDDPTVMDFDEEIAFAGRQ